MAGLIVTTAGEALLARVQVGECGMNLTSFVTGSGTWTPPEQEHIKDATALKHQEQQVTFSEKKAVENAVTWKAVVTNELITTTYYITEVGTYAAPVEDGVVGTPILYSIKILESPEPMNKYEGTVQSRQFNGSLVVSSDADVTVTTTGAFALASDLQEEIEARQELEKMIESNHYYASIADESGNVIVDDDNNIIAGDWRYKVM